MGSLQTLRALENRAWCQISRNNALKIAYQQETLLSQPLAPLRERLSTLLHPAPDAQLCCHCPPQSLGLLLPLSHEMGSTLSPFLELLISELKSSKAAFHRWIMVTRRCHGCKGGWRWESPNLENHQKIQTVNMTLLRWYKCCIKYSQCPDGFWGRQQHVPFLFDSKFQPVCFFHHT